MKLFVKFMAFIVVLALVAPFYLKGPDGKPLMALSKVDFNVDGFVAEIKSEWSDTKSAIVNMFDDGELKTVGSKTKVYRWRDTDGSWKFSNSLPAATIESEEVWIDPDANLIKAVEPLDASNSRNTSQESEGPPATSLAFPTTLSPTEISQLKEDATKVKELAEDRNKRLEEL